MTYWFLSHQNLVVDNLVSLYYGALVHDFEPHFECMLHVLVILSNQNGYSVKMGLRNDLKFCTHVISPDLHSNVLKKLSCPFMSKVWLEPDKRSLRCLFIWDSYLDKTIIILYHNKCVELFKSDLNLKMILTVMVRLLNFALILVILWWFYNFELNFDSKALD